MSTDTATDPATRTPEAAQTIRRRRWLLMAAGGIVIVVAIALAGGFLHYVSLVPTQEVVIERRADGIVALTGGPERIGDAVELLATGRGRRLLITGVNRATKLEELSRLAPQYEKVFACCVDLDHSAINTIGNAVETRRWMRERGFHSLVVVTSSYHMPRAMAELAHQLPDVALTAYPVVTDRQRAEPWWSSSASARLLVSEYLKYLVAVVRMHVNPTVADAALPGTAHEARN